MTAAGALVSQRRATGTAMRGMVTLVAEDGEEEERDPDGGEELGVGGALVGGEEHVRVDDVEDWRRGGRRWEGRSGGRGGGG